MKIRVLFFCALFFCALFFCALFFISCTRSKDLSFKNIGDMDINHCEISFDKVSYGGRNLFVSKGYGKTYVNITKLSNEGVIKWEYDGKLYQKKVSLKDMPKLFRGMIVLEIKNDSVHVKYEDRY